MKKTIFLVFSGLLFSSFVWAGPVPNDPCGGLRMGCTPWMKDLIADFHDGSDLLPMVGTYHGACYYHSHTYANSHEHYGALYLETDAEGTMFFNGTFSFFARPDRYADWNLEKARSLIANPFRYPMESYGLYSVADFSHSDGLWKYWVSQNPETKEIYLISYWSFFTRGFCRFQLSDTE